jgi:hypothetical protein
MWLIHWSLFFDPGFVRYRYHNLVRSRRMPMLGACCGRGRLIVIVGLFKDKNGEPAGAKPRGVSKNIT